MHADTAKAVTSATNNENGFIVCPQPHITSLTGGTLIVNKLQALLIQLKTPYVSRDRQRVHQAGISVRNRTPGKNDVPVENLETSSSPGRGETGGQAGEGPREEPREDSGD